MTDAADYALALSLLSPGAVRARCREIRAAADAGGLEHFTVHAERLPEAADYVVATIREKYPALDIPFHARWRHFQADGRNLWEETAAAVAWSGPAARGRSAFDLAIVSVLLDAGAGPAWRYRDAATGLEFARSEGLAIASLRMFEAGGFSANPEEPLRADADRLARLTTEDLASAFQADADNPLAGLEGRAALLRRLGHAIAGNPGVFALRDRARPGGLFDYLSVHGGGGHLSASDILRALLLHLGPIWPSRLSLGGLPLGDCWRHPAVKRADASDGLVPFHKLSQWLAYSLIEPLEEAGVAVRAVDGLTGLPEYRNGGLFLDLGVVALKNPVDAAIPHDAGSTLVVEWRALTVALLDELAALVRERLGLGAEALPLARVLEGGTWAAGRRIAKELREGGPPPLSIVSDGTVF